MASVKVKFRPSSIDGKVYSPIENSVRIILESECFSLYLHYSNKFNRYGNRYKPTKSSFSREEKDK